MRPRQRLLSAAVEGREALLDFFASLNREPKEPVSSQKLEEKFRNHEVALLCEVLQELDATQSKDLWSHLQLICVDALRDFASLISRREDFSETDQKHLKQTTKLLLDISCLCSAEIQSSNPCISENLLSTALMLHGSLLDFGSECPELTRNICSMCVEWWKHDLAGKEELCLNAILYLVNEALVSGLSGKGERDKCITQLCLLQKAFQIFSLSDAEANKTEENDSSKQEALQELRQLLLSAYLHPAFLKGRKTQKFLSHILLLNESLMNSIHQTIMKNILLVQKHAEAYGFIYYNAWALAEEAVKETIEDYCIQDIMYRAIHAPHEHKLFATYRSILQAINSHNKAVHVRYMLTRNYNPIIWRSLKATNAMVRYNATCLFLEAFPLLNSPDEHNEERDAYLQKQFTSIDSLLMDSCPQIRSTVVIGLFNILSSYWDVIPAQVIAVQARNLYTNMAFDSSSIAVRAAVFKGTVVLLGNPCSHPLLQKLLPTIGPCLHDASEKVRIEMCKVLLAVKQTSTIKYWDICPVDHILAQLEIENQTGTSRLAQLLTGSFLPEDQPIQTWVERCINFYQRNAAAARKFYLHAKDKLTAMESGEFIYVLSVFLFNQVSKSLEESEQNQQEENSETTSSFAEDPRLIASLLETICIVWLGFISKTKNISKAKDSKNDDKLKQGRTNSLREMTKRITIHLPRMIHVCFRKVHDERNLNALLQLSSCLYPASMPIFSKKVLPKLKSLPSDTPTSYYGMLIQCMRMWGWGGQVLELIADWLRTALTNKKAEDETNKKVAKKDEKSKPKEKSVKFNVEKHEPRIEQALRYLACFLQDEEIFSSVSSEERCRRMFDEISACLQCCSDELMSRLHGNNPSIPELTNTMLTNALEMQIKLLNFIYLSTTWKETGNTEESMESDGSLPSLQPIKNLFEYMHVEVVGQLKASTQAVESHNSTILSTTSLPAASHTTPHVNILTRLPLIRDCLHVAFPAVINTLKMGVPVAETALQFLAAFTETGMKTIDYIGYICSLYNELFDWYLTYVSSVAERTTDEQQSRVQTESEDTFVQIFDDVMVALMMYGRKNPDGFAQLFRSDARSSLRSYLSESFQYCNMLTQRSHAIIVRKVVSAILADLVHHTAASGEFRTRNSMSDLPQFSACTLQLICATAAETDYVCRNAIPSMFAEEVTIPEEVKQRNVALKACKIVVDVLSKDGKNPATAKACLSKLHDLENKKNLHET